MLEPSWVGRRVTVRRVVDHSLDGRPRFTDVVGDLVELDGRTAVVASAGTVTRVPLAEVEVAKIVPPSTAAELELERVVAAGWRAEETEPLGGWVLRAAGGFTGRANSVLPLRAPGMPLGDALEAVRVWYAKRGLPARFQVPTEGRRLLDAELGERGWVPSPDVHVMAARLDLLRRPAPVRDVELAREPDEAWLRRFRDGTGLEPAARALVQRHDRVAFAAVRDGAGAALAIARGTLDDGWLGVTAVEVAPAQRRQGLATTVVAALWDWATAAGALRTHVEVSADNLPAVLLYTKLGYWLHHDYRYRTEPDISDT